MRPGDHVFVRRSKLGVPYTHHGIAVPCEDEASAEGCDEAPIAQAAREAGLTTEVVHYSPEGVIVRTDWPTFSRGDEVRGVAYAETLQPSNIVSRASRHVGCKGYHLLGNNCEHFATWCATGAWDSAQVGITRAGLSLALNGVGLVAPPLRLVTMPLNLYLQSPRRAWPCDRCATPHRKMERTDGSAHFKAFATHRVRQAAADAAMLSTASARDIDVTRRPQHMVMDPSANRAESETYPRP